MAMGGLKRSCSESSSKNPILQERGVVKKFRHFFYMWRWMATNLKLALVEACSCRPHVFKYRERAERGMREKGLA